MSKNKKVVKPIFGWNEDGSPIYDFTQTALYKEYVENLDFIYPDGKRLMKKIKEIK